ncbi:hypothetical protein PCANC_23486 [Puccinia coronata f. sp. avenae]|uniref:Uncharacterized protein n=1 Tax=Puccinia coronata f. sp. avenae TaxID=200324 RepID=A0A2N5TT86_9BASI|nr:hypothetical protein PCANC_23486 [Puccinia coronata f. sp. avenae]
MPARGGCYLVGTRCKHWTKVELAQALADPNDPYKGPRKRGKSTRGKGQTPQSSLGSQSQSSMRAQTQATRSTNGKSPSATPSNLSGQTQTYQSSTDVSLSTQESSHQFTRSDYKHICFYLEDKENFQQIFASEAKRLKHPAGETSYGAMRPQETSIQETRAPDPTAEDAAALKSTVATGTNQVPQGQASKSPLFKITLATRLTSPASNLATRISQKENK